MKKSLLKLLMSLLMIMTATVTASAQCYILGNDGNWQTDKASAELQKTDIDGVYEGEVTFAPNAKQGRRIKLRCPSKVLTGTLHPSLPSIFSG